MTSESVAAALAPASGGSSTSGTSDDDRKLAMGARQTCGCREDKIGALLVLGVFCPLFLSGALSGVAMSGGGVAGLAFALLFAGRRSAGRSDSWARCHTARR